MKKLTIDRKTWYRGQRFGAALRRAEDGKQCCLGFYCVANGASPEVLVNKGFPHNLWVNDAWRNMHNVWYYIADINDSTNFRDEQREAYLKVVFREQLQTEVEFVN